LGRNSKKVDLQVRPMRRVHEGNQMKPSRQKRIRALLRSRPEGMTPIELSELLDIHVANVRTSLKAMPDTYVDRWRAAKRGQFEKVWVAVPVPDDCPHPKDRVKWGVNYKKPKTQWVVIQHATA
jgi:hypothetical protein